MSENGMIVADAMSRIHSILDVEPLPEPRSGKVPTEPPERYTPFVPITVSMPWGSFWMMSSHWASWSTRSTSCREALGLARRTFSRMEAFSRRGRRWPLRQDVAGLSDLCELEGRCREMIERLMKRFALSDGRIFQHDTGDGDALLFAPGEIHAFCADHRVDALGQLFWMWSLCPNPAAARFPRTTTLSWKM